MYNSNIPLEYTQLNDFRLNPHYVILYSLISGKFTSLAFANVHPATLVTQAFKDLPRMNLVLVVDSLLEHDTSLIVSIRSSTFWCKCLINTYVAKRWLLCLKYTITPFLVVQCIIPIPRWNIHKTHTSNEVRVFKILFYPMLIPSNSIFLIIAYTPHLSLLNCYLTLIINSNLIATINIWVYRL